MAKPKKIIRTKRIYKKQRPRAKKAANAVLFIILLAVLIGLGYIVSKEWSKRFSDDGDVSSELLSSASVQLADSSENDSQSHSESSESQAPAPIKLAGVRMPLGEMAKQGEELEAYMQKLVREGYTAVYVELKTDDGVVTYPSQNAQAQRLGVISDTPANLESILAAAKQAGLTPIARISALKDPKAAHVKNENSFGYQNSSEVNWLDDSPANGGKPWLNPYMENTRLYLSGLCAEADAYGFRHIVLENVTFPLKNTGAMGTLNEFTTREAILSQLVGECTKAVGEETVVYHGLDAAVSAAKSERTSYADARKTAGAEPQALFVSLDSIEKYRTQLLQKLAADGAFAADSLSAAAEMFKEYAASEGSEKLVLLEAKDSEILLPLLRQTGLDHYIINSLS